MRLLGLCLLVAFIRTAAWRVQTTNCKDVSCALCTSEHPGLQGYDCISCIQGFQFDLHGYCRYATWCPWGCSACDKNSSFACLSCGRGYELKDGECRYQVGYWDRDYYCDADEAVDTWLSRTRIGIAFGAILCIPLVIIASLPVCCGYQVMGVPLKRLGWRVGVPAGICNFIPLVSSAIAAKVSLDEACSGCSSCLTPPELRLGGIFYAYLYVGGFVVVALATATEILSCCMCFPCCCPLREEQGDGGAADAAAQAADAGVVGQPVDEASPVVSC